MRDHKDYGLKDDETQLLTSLAPSSIIGMILWAIVGGFVWYGLIWLMMVAFTILQEMVKT